MDGPNQSLQRYSNRNTVETVEQYGTVQDSTVDEQCLDLGSHGARACPRLLFVVPYPTALGTNVPNIGAVLYCTACTVLSHSSKSTFCTWNVVLFVPACARVYPKSVLTP
jgi:hypothetical protein